jgi:type VI protein secretion system component Hcp
VEVFMMNIGLSRLGFGLGRGAWLGGLGAIALLTGCGQQQGESPVASVQLAATGSFVISGTVTTSKGPTGGATVTLTGSETRTAFSDANGHYSIPGLGNGSYTLAASASATCASSTVNLNTLTSNVTVDLGMTGTGCPSVTFVPGPTGATGATGPAGATGPGGAKGATGATGPSGAAGATGPSGAAGPAGPIGPMGPAGLNGLPGSVGPQGPAGAQGPAGPAGAQGAAGPAGAQGPAGPAGAQGAAGPAGAQGPAGPQGDKGDQGPPGPAAGATAALPLVGVLTLGSVHTVPIRGFSQRLDVPLTVAGGGGSGAGKVTATPIVITRDVDRSTPVLDVDAAAGTVIPSAEIVLADGALTIDLEDVFITEIDVDGFQDDVPQEHLALTYARAHWSYSAQGQAAVAVDFDFETQAGGGGTLAKDFGFFGHGARSAIDNFWIPITDFSSGFSVPFSAAGGGAGVGKPAFTPLALTTGVGKQTIEDLGQLLAGSHADSVAVHFRAVDDQGEVFDRLRYELTNVLVGSVVLETTGTGTTLSENLGLAFEKVNWVALPNAESAEIQGGYDLAASKTF